MRELKLRTLLTLFLSVCLIFAIMNVPRVRAEEEETEAERYAAWYQAQYGTTPWGGTSMIGYFGPDYGIGEQGMVYQFQDPLTGSYVSYSQTGMGAGMFGVFGGYGGWNSPTAAMSYGPFAYGQTPQVMPTLGYGSQGYQSGSLLGPNTSYYSAQNPLMWMLGGGINNFYGTGYGGR